MIKLSITREVKLLFLFFCGIRFQIKPLAINKLGFAQRQAAIRNLIEHRDLLRFRGDIGHYYFALIWVIGDHIGHFIIVVSALIQERLVSMRNHQIVLYFTFSFFYLFLEQNGACTCCDINASSLIGFKFVLLARLDSL